MNISEDSIHLRWVRSTCYIEIPNKKIMFSCTSFYLEWEGGKGRLKYFLILFILYFCFSFSRKLYGITILILVI